MAGQYELEQRIIKNLELTRPQITEEDVKDATEWALKVNTYIGTLSLDTVNRMHANLEKYNKMYIQAVGKRVINDRIDANLSLPPETPHVMYNRIVENALEQITVRLAIALV